MRLSILFFLYATLCSAQLDLYRADYDLTLLQIDSPDYEYRESFKDDVYRFTIIANAPFVLQEARLVFRFTPQPDYRYFCNGYQSWTTSEERDANDRPRRLARILDPYSKYAGDYAIYDYPRQAGKLHSWSFTYQRGRTDSICLIASLLEDQAFTRFVWDAKAGRLEARLQLDSGIALQAGQSLDLFHFLIENNRPQVAWDRYAALLAQQQPDFRFTSARPASGWTSWYYHYTNINEKLILNNLHNFSKNRIPIDFFQIDDGYQQAVGDWTKPNQKFSGGMKRIADSIHAAGYQAGLWLAPLVAARRSETFRCHRDWFLKGKNGKPLAVANNVLWKGRYYALDIYQPAVRQHLRGVLDTILRHWGYDMIKVDFLFGAAISPSAQHNSGQYMAEVMRFLRECAGEDKRILGCGVPLASSFGRVDYCRIGNDAHLAWEFGILKKLRAAERPSTWSTLTNTILRYPLSGRVFRNDPDVFILRNKKTKLSEEEKKTLFLVNNLFGELLFTSDDISEYDSLQQIQYLSMFPLVEKQDWTVHSPARNAYQVSFRIGERRYLALLNLSEETQPFSLPEKAYYDADSNRLVRLKTVLLQPHQSRCWYEWEDGQETQLLGGRGHLFSGADIAEFVVENNGKIRLERHPQALGKQPIFIAAPEHCKELIINNKTYPCTQWIGFWGVVF